MKNKIKNISYQGFTLLEILISVAILGFVFIAAASYITTTLRITQQNNHTVMALHHAEALQEWVNAEQEADWDAFVQKADPSEDGKSYCFNNRLTHDSTWPTAGSCSDSDYQGITDIPPNIFNRELTLQSFGSPATRVRTKITVSWKELGKEEQIILERVYSLYQQ